MTALSVAPGRATPLTLIASFTLSITPNELPELLMARVSFRSLDSTIMAGSRRVPPIGGTGARRSLLASMMIKPEEIMLCTSCDTTARNFKPEVPVEDDDDPL